MVRGAVRHGRGQQQLLSSSGGLHVTERTGIHVGVDVLVNQLPPRWPLDLDRLTGFLATLPRGVRHAMEFREPSWYSPAVLRLLRRRGVALCLHDMPGSESARQSVGRFVYVRFHGSGARYGGSYPSDRLRDWAVWIRDRLAEGRDVFAYFNNDVGGHAPRDASALREAVDVA